MHIHDEPIVSSLLEVDWYKFTMGNFAFKRHRFKRVRYAFKNRHARRVCLPEFIREEELREQIEHVRTLRFRDDEIAFLRESRHIPKGLLSDGYLDALRNVQLPEVRIAWDKERYAIETEGKWYEAMLWETVLMNIVNQLYFREVMRREGLTFERVWAEGVRRLMKKIALLKTRPNLRFSTFGLRRGFMLAWGRTVDDVVCGEMPQQVAGISNVWSAWKHGLRPSGTCAHEMPMVYAGLYGETDEGLRAAPMRLVREWFQEYGSDWSVAIPDTFGSASFIDDLPKDLADGIALFKIDSGDPKERGDAWIKAFSGKWGIDPLSKRLIFCDGMTDRTMIELFDYFDGRVGLAPFGPGTHLTNDVGFTPISIVVKASAVLRDGAWVPLVKLSDNLEKASGPPEEIDRYVRVFQYGNRYRQECDV